MKHYLSILSWQISPDFDLEHFHTWIIFRVLQSNRWINQLLYCHITVIWTLVLPLLFKYEINLADGYLSSTSYSSSTSSLGSESNSTYPFFYAPTLLFFILTLPILNFLHLLFLLLFLYITQPKLCDPTCTLNTLTVQPSNKDFWYPVTWRKSRKKSKNEIFNDTTWYNPDFCSFHKKLHNQNNCYKMHIPIHFIFPIV